MKTILVIDDNQEFANMVLDYFKNEGYDVHIADTGADGIDKAKQIKPDIIFLDVMMPGVSGIEVLRALQEDEQTSEIPVIIITGSFFDKDMNDLFKMESNCKEFLSKTTELSLIKKKVEKILQK